MTGARLHTILASLALMLGLVHCAFALNAPQFTVSLLWFVGTGAGFICAALSNLLRGPAPPWLGLAMQNAVITGLFCAAWAVFPEPQVIAGGALFGLMLALSLRAMFRRPLS